MMPSMQEKHIDEGQRRDLYSAVDDDRIRRKLDRHMMPLFFVLCGYQLSFGQPFVDTTC